MPSVKELDALDAPAAGVSVSALDALDAPPAPSSSKRDAPSPGGLKGRVMERGIERAKEIATFPARVGRLVTGADKPESFEDVALLALGNAPLIAAGGAGAGALVSQLPKTAPALGRVLSAVGLAKGRGEDNVNALWEGVGAGTAEGVAAAASKVLGGPAKALEAIRARIGRGNDGPLNLRLLDSLMEWWKADPNKAVQTQRATSVVRNLLDMDPSREAARIFREQVMQGMKIPNPFRSVRAPAPPPGLSQAAEAVLGSPAARASADAAMSADPMGGVAPAVAVTQMPNPFKAAARMVMP